MESPRPTESTHVTSLEEGDGNLGSKGNLALSLELRVLPQALFEFWFWLPFLVLSSET